MSEVKQITIKLKNSNFGTFSQQVDSVIDSKELFQLVGKNVFGDDYNSDLNKSISICTMSESKNRFFDENEGVLKFDYNTAFDYKIELNSESPRKKQKTISSEDLTHLLINPEFVSFISRQVNYEIIKKAMDLDCDLALSIGDEKLDSMPVISEPEEKIIENDGTMTQEELNEINMAICDMYENEKCIKELNNESNDDVPPPIPSVIERLIDAPTGFTHFTADDSLNVYNSSSDIIDGNDRTSDTTNPVNSAFEIIAPDEPTMDVVSDDPEDVIPDVESEPVDDDVVPVKSMIDDCPLSELMQESVFGCDLIQFDGKNTVPSSSVEDVNTNIINDMCMRSDKFARMIKEKRAVKQEGPRESRIKKKISEPEYDDYVISAFESLKDMGVIEEITPTFVSYVNMARDENGVVNLDLVTNELLG
jgi:hypothetical protein